LTGFGFFLLHGVFQAYVTEVSTVHRGKVLALHSFAYFCGQGVGIVIYGFVILHFGKIIALSGSALVLLVLSCVCAAILTNRPPIS